MIRGRAARNLAAIITAIAMAAAMKAAAAARDVPARRGVIEGPLPAAVVRVVDGDTVDVRVQVWIGQTVEARVRIDGIDAPEMRGACRAERVRAAAARDELARLLRGGEMRISRIRAGKYAGRVVARARTGDGLDIAAHMVEKGLARPYGGGKRGAWCGA